MENNTLIAQTILANNLFAETVPLKNGKAQLRSENISSSHMNSIDIKGTKTHWNFDGHWRRVGHKDAVEF